MTVAEAARRAGRNSETVRRWIRAGRLRARKVGTLPLPKGMQKTFWGEPMPNVVAWIHRSRGAH